MSDPEILRGIHAYLAQHNKRQYELAAELGAPAQTVNRWMTGKTRISRAYRALLRLKGIIP